MGDDFRIYAAKRYMEHVRTIKNTVQQLQEEIDTARDSLTGLKAVTYSDMPVSPNAYGDAIPDGIARLQENIQQYVTEMAEWVEVEKEAHDAIARMGNGIHREVLWSHYVSGKCWEQIAFEVGYCYDHTRKIIFERALCELYDFMPEEWRRNLPNAEVV